jgi:hypothetical protein
MKPYFVSCSKDAQDDVIHTWKSIGHKLIKKRNK